MLFHKTSAALTGHGQPIQIPPNTDQPVPEGEVAMTFGIADLVSEISALVTLEPGDVILTGTPSDLGELDEPIFLAPGDRIRVEVDGVGVLENPVEKRLVG